jgi:iron complex outermembrane receptor protein
MLNALAYAVSLTLPLAAHAAIEEVIVTAQKRSESVQDVPIAINALAGDMLDDLGVSDTDDIEALYPNLSTNDSSAYNSGFAIRGVGTNNFHISGQQSVGTIIDEVATVSPFISAIGVFDMERVEVLRGPQNTLYGRNTTGGAINFYTRQANTADDFNGRMSLGAGNYGAVKFEGALGFKITDTLAARVAIMDDSFDGSFKNIVTGNDFGKKDKSGARLNLVWDASDQTSVAFTLATGDAEGDAGYRRHVGNLSPDGATPCPAFLEGEAANIGGKTNCWSTLTANQVAGNQYLSEQLAANNSDFIMANPNVATNSSVPYLVNYSSKWGTTYVNENEDFYKAEFDGVRFKVSHDFENVSLFWISSYDQTYVIGANPNDLSGFASYQEGDWEVFQHELRLVSTSDGPFRWLAGFYYSDQESEEDTWVYRTDPGVAGGNGLSPSILIDAEYEAMSAYTKLDYDLSESWSLTAGLRYTDDKLEGDTRKFVCLPGQHNGATIDGSSTYDRGYREANCTDISAGLIDRNPTQELTELGWKIGLNWHAGDSTLVYGSVSEGFKGGAFDNRALDNGSAPIGPEFLMAYELGVKSDLFDNTLQLNASVYFYEWEGLQLFGLDDSGGPAQVNVPKTELKGLELEVKWSPINELYVQAGIGLSETEITDVSGLPAGMGIQEGFEITNAPDSSASLLVVNTIPLESSEIILQASYRYSSDYFLMLTNDDSRAKADSVAKLNARMAYNFGDDRQHSIALYANNLTKERACVTLNTSLPGVQNWQCQADSDGGETLWGLSFETNF